jgi:hypothetical protein
MLGDAPVLAGELAAALVALSADLAALRRRIPPPNPIAVDVGAVDDALSRSIVLARRLLAAIRSHAGPAASGDAVSVATELAKHLAPALSPRLVLTVVCRCPSALTALPAPSLRRLLATLVLRVLERLTVHSGELALEVSELRTGTGPETVEVALGHRGLTALAAAEAADHVRHDLQASGGLVQARARLGGGTTIIASLPAGC